jgi:hypothetical protein
MVGRDGFEPSTSMMVGPPGFEPGISAVLIHRQCEGDVLTSWTTGPFALVICYRDRLAITVLGA